MQKQVNVVLQPFLNFKDFVQPTKTHNMVALMLDLRFKYLNLVGNYVGHAFVIEIATIDDVNLFLPTLKIVYQKLHGHSSTTSVMYDIMRNINVVFKIGVSKEETCIEQVSVGIFYFQILKLVCKLKFIFCLCLHFSFCTCY